MADQSDRPEPEVEQDAREGEVGDVGYPEAQPGGAAATRRSPRRARGPAGRGPGTGRRRRRAVAGEHDGPPSRATGNPRAAGP